MVGLVGKPSHGSTFHREHRSCREQPTLRQSIRLDYGVITLRFLVYGCFSNRRHSSAILSSPRRPSSTILIFSSAPYCLRVARRMSFTTAPADGFECFAFIFVPYSHYDEPKTLTYFMRPACLLNADGGHFIIVVYSGFYGWVPRFDPLVEPFDRRRRLGSAPLAAASVRGVYTRRS